MKKRLGQDDKIIIRTTAHGTIDGDKIFTTMEVTMDTQTGMVDILAHTHMDLDTDTGVTIGIIIGVLMLRRLMMLIKNAREILMELAKSMKVQTIKQQCRWSHNK